MNRSLFFSFFVLLLIAAPLVPAQAAEGIAIVNIQQIMRDSTAAKSARDQLKAKQEQFQNEIKAEETKLKTEDQELAKQRSVLAPDAFQQKVKAFQEKARGVQGDAQQKQAKLTKAFNAALGELQKNIVDIISELAKEKGFAVALPSTQTLYSDPSLDITNEVLTRLNQRLTKVTINFQ